MLEGEKISVLEADSGVSARRVLAVTTPSLVLQSLVLPDCDGFELVAQLKQSRENCGFRVIAVSGFLSHAEVTRVLDAGFDDFLTKPIEPSRLAAVVRVHLAALDQSTERFGTNHKIVVVDDDPMQLKLTRIRLEQLGFEVFTALNGEAALKIVESSAPDAVVTDALMPGIDGFELCVRIRRSPRLGKLPVVMVTSSCLETEDRQLAQRMGASAFVVRTPSLGELIEALRRVMRQPTRESVRMRAVSLTAQDLTEERLHRLAHQLEQQVARNTGLIQRHATLAAERSVLTAISDALVQATDKDEALRSLLVDCLDAAGLLHGAIYVVEPNGELTLRTQAGPSLSRRGPLHAFARHPKLLKAALQQDAPIEIPSSALTSHRSGDDRSMDAESTMLVVPLRLAEETLGALVLVTSGHELDTDWRDFVRTLAAQISVALALLRSFVAVTRSEQRYRALLNSAKDAILIGDQSGLIREVNPTAQQLLGQSRDELCARSLFEIISEARVGWPSPGMLRPSTARSFASELTRSDGSLIQVETSLSFVEDGIDVLFFAIVRDVTTQQRLENELRQSQKMEAVGQLAGGVAHDFNNLLAVITSYADLLTADLDAADPHRADVLEIREAAERAAGLTRQLLTFSRREKIKLSTLNLNDTVTQVEGLLRRVIGENIRLETKLTSLPRSIRADAVQMEQIVINLVVNARDAMPNGGVITIETSELLIDEALQATYSNAMIGHYVRLSITDTGEGMSPEIREHIFEPFFTTKPPGKGTGLGLSTLYGIVRQCRGVVTVRSALGAGTTFDVLLPCIDERRSEAPAARRESSAETILLAEDSPSIRRATTRILERAGYTVLEAASGLEALAICKAYPAKIQLFLTDIIMPGPSGRAIAMELTRLRPAMKVLYMSGRADTFRKPEDGLEAPLIEKPFTAAALAGKVREILDPLIIRGAER
jgi:PAS domain S-box-containing protein